MEGVSNPGYVVYSIYGQAILQGAWCPRCDTVGYTGGQAILQGAWCPRCDTVGYTGGQAILQGAWCPRCDTVGHTGGQAILQGAWCPTLNCPNTHTKPCIGTKWCAVNTFVFYSVQNKCKHKGGGQKKSHFNISFTLDMQGLATELYIIHCFIMSSKSEFFSQY